MSGQFLQLKDPIEIVLLFQIVYLMAIGETPPTEYTLCDIIWRSRHEYNTKNEVPIYFSMNRKRDRTKLRARLYRIRKRWIDEQRLYREEESESVAIADEWRSSDDYLRTLFLYFFIICLSNHYRLCNSGLVKASLYCFCIFINFYHYRLCLLGFGESQLV